MKLKNILNELDSKKEPLYQKGRKIITIECNDSAGELEKFLNWWKSMGDIGHSAVVHCDAEQPTNIIKIFCDGDGADRTKSIIVKMLPNE